jgi:hypothetical protein
MLKPNRIKWVAVLHAQVIPGPNHGLGTNYPDRCIDFSQFLHANARIVPTIIPYPLPSTSLPPLNPTPHPYLRVS